jgi:DsbC/DsbD-like thiol-disulfide interchange protein/cytochrome c biogenesis protein CcdA
MLMRLMLLWLALLGAQLAMAEKLSVPGQLIAETDTPTPGKTVTLAFLFEPRPGWHGYWENPGDAGLGLQLEWQLPQGVKAGKPRYPVPDPLLIGGLMNHVYERPFAVLVDLQLSPDLSVGAALPIKVRGEWLACTDKICVPQTDEFALELTSGTGKIDPAQRQRFDRWRTELPVPLDQPARFAIDGDAYRIAIPYPARAPIDRPWFFALGNDSIRHAAAQKARRVGDWLVIESEALPGAKPVEGLLRIGDGQGLLVRTVAGVIPKGGDEIGTLGPGSAKAGTSSSTMALPWLLLAALMGGLLLNLMPCVFPILGLKALALAKAGGNEADARGDALAYSAGVVLSCVALGGLLLALRAGGEEIGWAFQLQEPAFVLFLLLLMVAVTANLAGLFELTGLGRGETLSRLPGRAGSFWTGVLAALVATPCTGPFMAAALGAALLLPTAEALALFAALGLGIAMPFLAIAYVARLRRMLPRSGPWLTTFRRAMAVPMALTTFALAWLIWRQAGDFGLWIGIGASSILIALLWLYARSAGSMRHAGAAALMATLAIYGAAAHFLPTEGARSGAAAKLDGESFNPQRLIALRKEGRPIFLYFTADWCVTCKVNEAAAIGRAETKRLFEQSGVTVMVGDFTRRDPAIARFLEQHGRSGVPLYLYYPPKGAPVELPQLLTPGQIEDAVSGRGAQPV